MPYVTDDTDILERTITPFERSETLPHVPPPSRRSGFQLFIVLRRLITFARGQRALRTQHNAPHTREFELPLDVLARKYPDLYMRVMTGSG